MSESDVLRHKRKFEKMSRDEKKKDPMISKKDLRRKDGLYFGMKIRAAAELGLLEAVRKRGWGGLSAADTGRIGGHMSRLMRSRAAQPGGDDRSQK
ncbi:MAG: small, acid-soluble spore protein, alpha/beta type [Bacillota bacterium]